ncbi:MAG: AIR synthase family protein [archaeon GBS-70-058]|nr:AIR synthase family protein [Candidatus Culexarchaeum nevadense]
MVELGYLGKVPPSILEKYVFSRIGVVDERVLVKPSIGEDAAVIDFEDKVLVVHSDPITGASKHIGWLSICVSTNDVATRGAIPKWVSMVILLPENFDENLLDSITREIDDAAKKLGVMIVCGHTEVTPKLDRPILISTAFGEVSKGGVVTTRGAKPGDLIILSKGACIEGTFIFANEFYDFLIDKVPRDVIDRALGYINLLSVLKDAQLAVGVGGVTSMHDPTEGGVLGGLQEMAQASSLGFILYEDKVIVNEETKLICEVLGVDPLKTISSGALLISAKPDYAESIVNVLRDNGIKASIIGRFTNRESGWKIVKSDGSVLEVSEPVVDELWRIYGKFKSNPS